MKKIFTLLFVVVVPIISYAQLSGSYYIPQGSHPQGFPTLAAACSTLTADGASGTVYFYIDGDLSEIGANLIITRSDLNATNNLVIKPAPGKTPTITISGCAPSTASGTQPDTAKRNSGFTLNYTGFVTIDGSNTTGGTTRDLTFALNDVTNGRHVIHLFGNCDNVTLQNLKVIYAAAITGTTGNGVFVNGQSSGAALGSADNFTIENCQVGVDSPTLLAPFFGISFTGASAAAIHCTNGVIKNNEVYGRIRGINLFWSNSSTSTLNVFGNTVKVLNPPSGFAVWGTLLNTYAGTTNFYNNKIITMRQTTTGTQGMYAFGTLNGETGPVVNVYNNFLGGDFEHTGTGTPASIDVISFQDAPTGGVANVYYNTVVLNNMAKTASGRQTCIRLAGEWAKTVRNNIFINHKNASVAYCIFMGATTGTHNYNYNVLYASGAAANIGYWTSANQTLSAWQTASGQDPNSVSTPVTFVSATDFHLAGSSIGDNNLIAPPLFGYTTDIDGQTRDPYYPYKGADESLVKKLPSALFTVSMSPSLNNIQAFGNGSMIGSDGLGIDFYVNWDTTYLYLGWSGGRTNYSSDMYYAAIDIDPDGTNGTTNAIEGVGFLPGAQRPDYYVVYENNSSFYGVPASEGNAFEVYGVSGGAWSWISRTGGDDGTSSQVVFADGGGEVRLRVPWSALGGFTPGAASKLGIVMWNNNPTGNYMWARVPNSNPDNGPTPKTLTHQFVFASTGAGVNPASDKLDAVFPVEVTSFVASYYNGKVVLTWRTESEINNYGWEIERSKIDDKTNKPTVWEKIGFVKGSGNSNSPKEYSFVDLNVLYGYYAYRLKQVDNDGSYSYSEGVRIFAGSKPQVYDVKNYPNPFNPQTTIRFELPEGGNVKLSVYDITGQLVKVLVDEWMPEGVHERIFDGSNLASGIYISVLQAKDVRVVKKMQLIK